MFDDDRWIRTPSAQRMLWRKRRAVEVAAFAEIEPRSKKSIKDQDKRRFQNAIAGALGSRSAFRAPVALELQIHASANNPPEIHTVAKAYLDLLYNAPRGEVRLLRDDRQVRYLCVDYSLKIALKPSFFLTTTRMSTLRQDATLLKRIRRGDLRWNGYKYRSTDFEHSDDDDALERLRDWRRSKARRIKEIGAEAFNAMDRMYVAEAQRHWLTGTQHLLNDLLLNTVVPLPMALEEGPQFDQLQRRLKQQFQSYLCTPGVSVPMGDLPQRSGEGQRFFEHIDQGLHALKEKHPFLFPLIRPLAVVILLFPSSSQTAQTIDLDNLARKVVPRVHAILEPPTRPHLVDPTTVVDPGLRAFFEKAALIARRLPKHHIARYEVIELPTSLDDSGRAAVQLALCDGEDGRPFGRFVREEIEQWADSDPDR